jgi:hypothetical protein
MQHRLAADDILGVFSRRFQEAMAHADIRGASAPQQAALTGYHADGGYHDQNGEKENRKNFIQGGAKGLGSTHSLNVSREEATTYSKIAKRVQKTGPSTLPFNPRATAPDHRMI